MLPVIRAAVGNKAKTAVKDAAVDNLSSRLQSASENRKYTNAERIKGVFNNLKSSNSDAQAAAMAKNNESTFEQQSLTLLSSINGNTEELLNKLSDTKKSKGLLSSLLGGLSLLLTPFMSRLGKGLAILASPFKLLARGIGFIGKKLLALFKFLKIGNITKAAGAVAGKVAGGVGASVAKVGAVAAGTGALIGKVASKTGIKTLSKGAAKMGSKLVPGVGLAVGAGFAAKRASDGDYIGAIGEAASGLASTVPGIGTAAALAIQAGLIARDLSKNANRESEKTIRSTRQNIDAVNANTIHASEQQKSSLDKFTTNLNDMATKTKDKVLSNTEKMLDMIKKTMPTIFTGLGDGVKKLMSVLGEKTPQILTTIKNSVAGVVAFASSPLTTIINKIMGMIPGMGGNSTPDSNYVPGAAKNASELAKKNFTGVKSDLKSAASKFNVDPGLLAKIAYFESGKTFSTTAAPVSSNSSRNKVYNKGAGKMAMSSAHGLGQFTDARWYDTLRKDGGKMGIGSNLSKSQMDNLRSNKKVQAMALASLAKDNLDKSANISGGDRAADVYVLHNLGQTGGSNFLRKLRTAPNTKVSSLLGSTVIRNNPSLYGNGNITVKQAYNNMRKHIGDGQQFSNEIGGGSLASRVTKAAIAAPTILASTAMSSVFGSKSKTPTKAASNKNSDMGGAGVLKTGGKSRHAPKLDMTTGNTGRMSTSTPAGVANVNFSSPLSMKDGDKIAQAAEGMIGDQSDSFGLCARAVWFMLGRAGVPGFPKTSSQSSDARKWGASGIAYAKQAASILVSKGFREVTEGDTIQNGDVDVLGPRTTGTYKGKKVTDDHPGHIQVYANGTWYSDHKQSSRYSTSTYKWRKTFRYGNGGSTSGLSVDNTEPSIPDENLPMTERIANMMSSVFTSDKLDGLRDFIKGGDLDPAKAVVERASPIGAYTGSQETIRKDFGIGPNKNGTLSDDFERVRLGSKERQYADTTGIRETAGFTGSKERQWADSTGVKNTQGFQGSDERQWGDTTGIRDTTGFKGSSSRQGGSSSSKSKWWEKLFTGELGNILNGAIPGFGALFGLIKNKDYAGILGTVTGMPQLGNIAKAVENEDYGAIVRETTGNTGLGKIVDAAENEDYEGVVSGVLNNERVTNTSENGTFAGIQNIPVAESMQVDNPFNRIYNGGINGDKNPVTGYSALSGLGRIANAVKTKDYSSVISNVTSNNQLGGIYSNIKSKNYKNVASDVLPTDKFITEGLGKITDINFENKIKLQTRQAEGAIVAPPAQSHTVNTGSSDGAVIPISVRNNDSIIKEIAKEYLRNSL